ncbi:4-hydroxy-tetrahydrodipicolinate synthase [Iamia sp. SCSIO 61187]|uniref:4-hydroxy-tetrahydrodipicolinate synthase n=1 Tax=Iamia sp. SCSIO 61187 TaxID=2722752 RepID=UPI001C632743|nr:4-hydroxy-tetrahydrodipicolinate synthase [Iamia sp. SCSIO 61187]QYG93277.1 4-hydroxy-tetrahydrodipicolinate synthase [Iamia sp. SCSIO 61187]
MARFGRVLTAMATPFAPDGSLDAKAAGELARWLVDHGNEGLVVAGTTGESPVLSDEERIELFRAVRAAVDVPLVAGTTTNDTAHSVELTRAAAEVGVDAVLAVTPYYNKPPQSGLVAHFEAVAAASDLPVMLYDVPGRTGRKIATDTILGLARDVPTIVALKDAGGDPAETGRLIAAAPAGFEVYSGDEPLTLAFLAYGAVGVVGVASHWTAALQVDMFFAFEAGDTAGARAVNARLLPSYAYMNSETCVFSQAVKVMMAELGVPIGECRLPLGPAPEGTAAAARAVARDLRLLV